MARSEPEAPAAPWARGAMERVIGVMLRTGVLVSASVVLVGGILYLLRHGWEVPDYRHFSGEPVQLRTLAGLLADLRDGNARSVIQVGLLLLIATPVLRVAFTAWVFVRQRDWLYVVITLLVLAILGVSLLAPDWESGLSSLHH